MLTDQLIIMIYGIPASGKTTLLLQLIAKLQSAYYLSLDDLEKSFFNQIIIHPKNHNLVNNLVKINQQNLTFDQQVYNKSRALGYELVHSFIRTMKNESFVLIVQDDFLLLSSKKRYKSLAKAYGLKFISILCDTQLQRCIEHQQKRKKLSSIEIIEQAYKKLEVYPSSLKLSLLERQNFEQVCIKIQEHLIKVTQKKTTQNQKKSCRQEFQNKIRKLIKESILKSVNKQIGSQLSILKKQFLKDNRQYLNNEQLHNKYFNLFQEQIQKCMKHTL